MHLLRETNLTRKPSTITDQRPRLFQLVKGLFAIDTSAPDDAILFHRGDEIIEYTCDIINDEELDDRYGEYTAPP
jgi:hypothetical protein